jgi:hypothetical protein
MPNCTAEQAAYDLAVVTESVRFAQAAVEQAEAMLASMLYTAAVSDRMVKAMALNMCLMSSGPPRTLQAANEEALVILRETVAKLRTSRDERMDQAKKRDSELEDASQRVE